MKRTVLSLAFVLVTAAPTLAQQPAPSPQEQALSNKLIDEINQSLQYRAALIQAQAQVADLKKQLDDAKAKEPDKPTPEKP